jgi:hypothetical protein
MDFTVTNVNALGTITSALGVDMKLLKAAAISAGYGTSMHPIGITPHEAARRAGYIENMIDCFFEDIPAVAAPTVRPRNSFFLVEKSERNVATFFAGVGLSKIFADLVLSSPYLYHVSQLPPGAVTFRAPGGAVGGAPAGPIGKHSTLGLIDPRGIPDFIATDSTMSCWHVIEAKGRSRNHATKFPAITNAMRKALSQAIAVELVHGAIPTTSTGLVAAICRHSVKVHAEDPVSQGPLNISFDINIWPKLIYRFFFDIAGKRWDGPSVGDYKTIRIGRNVAYGLHKSIKRLIDKEFKGSFVKDHQYLGRWKRTLNAAQFTCQSIDNAAYLSDGTALFIT